MCSCTLLGAEAHSCSIRRGEYTAYSGPLEADALIAFVESGPMTGIPVPPEPTFVDQIKSTVSLLVASHPIAVLGITLVGIVGLLFLLPSSQKPKVH